MAKIGQFEIRGKDALVHADYNEPADSGLWPFRTSNPYHAGAWKAMHGVSKDFLEELSEALTPHTTHINSDIVVLNTEVKGTYDLYYHEKTCGTIIEAAITAVKKELRLATPPLIKKTDIPPADLWNNPPKNATVWYVTQDVAVIYGLLQGKDALRLRDLNVRGIGGGIGVWRGDKLKNTFLSQLNLLEGAALFAKNPPDGKFAWQIVIPNLPEHATIPKLPKHEQILRDAENIALNIQRKRVSDSVEISLTKDEEDKILEKFGHHCTNFPSTGMRPNKPLQMIDYCYGGNDEAILFMTEGAKNFRRVRGGNVSTEEAEKIIAGHATVKAVMNKSNEVVFAIFRENAAAPAQCYMNRQLLAEAGITLSDIDINKKLETFSAAAFPPYIPLPPVPFTSLPPLPPVPPSGTQPTSSSPSGGDESGQAAAAAGTPLSPGSGEIEPLLVSETALGLCASLVDTGVNGDDGLTEITDPETFLTRNCEFRRVDNSKITMDKKYESYLNRARQLEIGTKAIEIDSALIPTADPLRLKQTLIKVNNPNMEMATYTKITSQGKQPQTIMFDPTDDKVIAILTSTYIQYDKGLAKDKGIDFSAFVSPSNSSASSSPAPPPSPPPQAPSSPTPPSPSNPPPTPLNSPASSSSAPEPKKPHWWERKPKNTDTNNENDKHRHKKSEDDTPLPPVSGEAKALLATAAIAGVGALVAHSWARKEQEKSLLSGRQTDHRDDRKKLAIKITSVAMGTIALAATVDLLTGKHLMRGISKAFNHRA